MVSNNIFHSNKMIACGHLTQLATSAVQCRVPLTRRNGDAVVAVRLCISNLDLQHLRCQTLTLQKYEANSRLYIAAQFGDGSFQSILSCPKWRKLFGQYFFTFQS